MQPSSASSASLTDAQLEELSADPKNRVFREEASDTHEPWDPAESGPMFRRIHAAFVAHAVAQPSATYEEDEAAAVAIVRAGGAETVRLAQEHPAIVGKLTTRDSALDSKQVSVLWRMLELRGAVHAGETSEEDAQRQLVSETLTSFLRPADDGATTLPVPRPTGS